MQDNETQRSRNFGKVCPASSGNYQQNPCLCSKEKEQILLVYVRTMGCTGGWTGSSGHQEAFDRLGKNVNPEWYDPADYVDAAHDAGISFYIMADGMRQGVINLFATGLYHLFEQWFLKFHRRELLWFHEDRDLSLVNWKEAKKRLLKNYGIDVDGIPSWLKVSELRLLANAVKHAEGTSCEELKSLRPDLFVSPHLEKDGSAIDLVKIREVFQPLAGEDLYVSLEEFDKYVEAVKLFWDELANAFDAIKYE